MPVQDNVVVLSSTTARTKVHRAADTDPLAICATALKQRTDPGANSGYDVLWADSNDILHMRRNAGDVAILQTSGTKLNYALVPLGVGLATIGTDIAVKADVTTGGNIQAANVASNGVGLDINAIAGVGIEADGSANLRLAAQGTGIAGGAGSTLSIALNSTIDFSGCLWTFTPNELQVVGTPDSANDAVNKAYVDSAITGLTWKDPASTMQYLGTRTIVQINALSPASGDTVVAGDAGTPTAGSSDLLAAGDVAEYNGTEWKKIVAHSGNFVPAGTRLVIHDDPVTLFAPLTEGADEGKIAVFSGSSNTPSLTTPSDGWALLVIGEGSVNENIGFTYDASAWIQFTGAGQINAGTGLTKSGNTINAIGGNGITANDDDLVVDPATAVAGSRAAVYVGADGVGVNLDNSTLSHNASVLQVKANGIGATEIDETDNFTWSGTNNFTGTLQINATTITSTAAELNILDGLTTVTADLELLSGSAAYGLTGADLDKLADIDATATEIDQALDGISGNVTFGNLNILTGGTLTTLHKHTMSSLDDTDYTGISNYAIQYWNGSDWVDLNPGTSGQFLKTNAGVSAPVWETISGTISDGTVTDSVLRWDGNNWVENVNFEIDTSGNVKDGQWQADAIANTYGGTGQNSSGWTGVAKVAAGVWSVEAQLDETRGGTAQSAYAKGDILYASAINTLAKLTKGTTGHVLTQGASEFPEWAAATTTKEVLSLYAPLPISLNKVVYMSGANDVAVATNAGDASSNAIGVLPASTPGTANVDVLTSGLNPVNVAATNGAIAIGQVLFLKTNGDVTTADDLTLGTDYVVPVCLAKATMLQNTGGALNALFGSGCVAAFAKTAP